MMTYSYYPGCTLKNKARALDRYARASAQALGFELSELENWQCCGAVYPQASDEIATRLSSVRALSDARARNTPLVTLCSACHHVIKRVNADMQNNADIRAKVNNYLQSDATYTGAPYAGETRVLHYLEVLRDEVGFDNLKKLVKKPLTGRKIAAYYGCLLLRPSGVMAFDDPENPTILEDFIRAIGAEPVITASRNECCGAYRSLEAKDAARAQVEKLLRDMKAHGADSVITACPLCQYNLTENAGDVKLPVIYFTELLAEALDVKEAADRD